MPIFDAIRRVILPGVILTLVVTPLAAQRASPRDTAQATVGGGTLLIDYSRPSMRGREIFGGLVPFGQPWRAGADRATHFTTDKALAFGSTTVPAGTYTLHILPISTTAWKLIISKKTDIWGIPYPEGQDLVRLDMQVSQIAAPMEMMEWRVEAQGAGGVLRLRWDRTEGSIPFTVRP